MAGETIMALIKVNNRGQSADFQIDVGGRRRLNHNGAMVVSQRQTSEASVNSDRYSACDRYKIINNQGHFTVSQETLSASDTPFTSKGMRNALKLDVTTAQASPGSTDRAHIRHAFEGKDVQELCYGTSSAKSVTVSFWVKATKTGTNCVTAYQDDGGKAIGLTYTISASNTWEYKSVTFPGNTADLIANDNTRGLLFEWRLAAGTDRTSGTLRNTWTAYVTADECPGQVNHLDNTANNFHLTGVQIEIGTTATDFEHRSVKDELHSCQRYFQRVLDQNRVDVMRKSGTSAGHYLSYFQEMRTSPTLSLTRNSTVYGPVNTGAGSSGLDPAQNRSTGFTLYVYTSGTDVQVGAVCTVTADAEL
jgi:hypothetical protein